MARSDRADLALRRVRLAYERAHAVAALRGIALAAPPSATSPRR